jgi:hypothetical protein
MSREAFRNYYESRHARLAVRYVHFRKYVRNYLIAPSNADFDVITEIWLANLSEIAEVTGSAVGELLREDEKKLMAPERFRATAEERLIVGGVRTMDVGRVEKYALMLVRHAYAAKADFIVDVGNWGRQLALDPVVTRVTMDIVVAEPGSTFPADGILSFWCSGAFDIGTLDILPASVESAEMLTLDAYETPRSMLDAAHSIAS